MTGFPGGSVVKNPPDNAGHAGDALSGGFFTTEPPGKPVIKLELFNTVN